MFDLHRIGKTFRRNRRAVSLRPTLGQGTAVTRVRLREGLTAEIEDGRWRLVTGMSEKSGGDAAGPDPGVLGRGALGACLGISYLMWAAKEGVPLDSVEVEVHADYDVRGEYDLDGVSPAYSQIRTVVTVESEAPEEDVVRVLDRADRVSPYLHLFRDAQDVRVERRLLAPRS
jgi:uncharacterized OsmC-like protein